MTAREALSAGLVRLYGEDSEVASAPAWLLASDKFNALEGTPISITMYKLGDKYIGARSNEFGYANYEFIPTQTELSPLSANPRSRPR